MLTVSENAERPDAADAADALVTADAADTTDARLVTDDVDSFASRRDANALGGDVALVAGVEFAFTLLGGGDDAPFASLAPSSSITGSGEIGSE